MNTRGIVGKILISFAICILSSCAKNDNTDVVLIGDSIIDRWDIQADFPTMIIDKCGKGGARLDYLDSFAGKMKGKTVVVLIGTNDNRNWDESYVDTYMEYADNMLASAVIIVSVLPRAAEGDRVMINEDIANLNEELMSMSIRKGWKYVDAYPQFLGDDGHINDNLYTDGLHLSDFGYGVLGNMIKEALR